MAFFNDWEKRDDWANKRGLWHMRFSTSARNGTWYCCYNERHYEKWHNDWKKRDKYAEENDLWNERFSFPHAFGGRVYCCYTSKLSYR